VWAVKVCFNADELVKTLFNIKKSKKKRKPNGSNFIFLPSISLPYNQYLQRIFPELVRQ
jgi:hypothetical protein